MLTRDVGAGATTQVSFEQMMAELLLLSDQGYGDARPADDPRSRRFAARVRRINKGWQPGTIPRVPAFRRAITVVARPRKILARRASRGVRRTSSRARSPGRLDPDEPAPALGRRLAWSSLGGLR
jgi:hypothetical protein